MRIAAMVVGILFAIWFFFEAVLIVGLSNAGGDDAQATMAAGGIVAAILIGLGAVLALSVPHISMILFILGGLVSLLTAAGGYTNHWVYAFFGFMLAIFAFFGRRGQLKERREKAAERQRHEDRDNRMEAMVYQQTLLPCPSCGHRNAPDTRFCGDCGKSLRNTEEAQDVQPAGSASSPSPQAQSGHTPTQKVEKRSRFRRS